MFGDDGCIGGARWKVHDGGIGWKGGECECGEGVHDEVDPEHLGDGEGGLGGGGGADEDDETGGDVDGKLEEDEALDVLVEGASPEDGGGDGVEGVVEDGDVGGFFGDGGTVTHREADVGGGERGCVVGAIAGDGDDVVK